MPHAATPAAGAIAHLSVQCPRMPHRQPLITAAAAIAIVAVTMLAYIPGMHGGFIWDDDPYVTEYATLRSLDGLVDIWTRPRSIPQYYPLVHTTYWLEYHAWGAQPAGYKIVNAALHALAALMLWRVLRRLAVPGAWLAAVLFAIHPVQVESVTWITERKNVLSSLMYFASFYCALRWLALDRPAAQPPDHHPSPDKLHRWYILAGLLFLGALLSKTVTCSLPAAVLLVVWWKRGRIQRREVLGMAPFFLVGFVFAMVTAQLERHHVGALGEDWALGLLDRTLIASRAVFFYLAKLAWPTDLSFIYPRWRIDTTAWQQYLPIVLLAVLAALLILRRRQLGRGPIVIALLYLGTLLPALGFFNIYPMRYTFVADHYQYLASAAVFTAIAAVLSRGLVRLRLAPRSAACLAVAIVLAILFPRAWDRRSAYQALRSLWTATLEKTAPPGWRGITSATSTSPTAGSMRPRRITSAPSRSRPTTSWRTWAWATWIFIGGNWTPRPTGMNASWP